MVTHLTTNPPVRGLMYAERTGRNVFLCQWSYVLVIEIYLIYISAKLWWERHLQELEIVTPMLLHQNPTDHSRTPQNLMGLRPIQVNDLISISLDEIPPYPRAHLVSTLRFPTLFMMFFPGVLTMSAKCATEYHSPGTLGCWRLACTPC